ncbi:MAG: sec-independent translocase [Nocardioides sp.]
MFGIGLQELALIAFVAVLVVGPDRLPELARQAGRMVRSATKMANQAKTDLRQELGPEFADLRLQDLDPRTIVRKHIAEALKDLDAEERAKVTQEVAAELAAEQSGERPPFDSEAT